ncbi:hypothetical protein ACEPAH_7125 [Sanghuangporus vaninii]
MCIGNRAEVSVHYINGQLRALFENAQHCAKKHLDGFKPSASAVEYATCLAEFYGPSKHVRQDATFTDLPFFVKFGCPRVEFVCNHEAVLFLNLREGHYNLDINKVIPKRELNEQISNCTLAFRIPFSSHAIEKYHCKAIGNADNYTSILHVLEMQSAVLVSEHSSFPAFKDTQDSRTHFSKDHKVNALAYYLTKFYLPTIKRAGLHVFYSLPDFDNLTSTSSYIDYSVTSTRALATDTLFGVRIEDVNNFLRGLWLQAATFVDEYGLSAHNAEKSFLAELRMPPIDDVDDMHLHLFFGPLHVRPLCNREVVLYLDVQDIHVHFGGFGDLASEQLKHWKIAFIVDVIVENSKEGSKKCIKLDISTARFCEHLSIFGKHHDTELLVRIKRTLIHQITTYYIHILETSELTIIYNYDPCIHGPSDTGSEDDEPRAGDIDVHGCWCPDEGSCGHTGGIRWGVIQRRILMHTHTGDFDLAVALTQGSINSHFKALWEFSRRRLSLATSNSKLKTWSNQELQRDTCLASFSFVHVDHKEEEFFCADFEAPKIQLVCKEGSQKAILYLYLKKGHLKTLGSGKSLKPGSNAFNFARWRLAFEVDLNIIDSSQETMSGSILRRLALDQPTGLKQLVLALSSAKFNLSLSSVPGLLDGNDYCAIRSRCEALSYYIKTCYFPVLKRAKHHVLYTIPHTIPGANHKQHLLTSLRFEIIPFVYSPGMRHLEGISGHYRAVFERNSIVITGMTRGRSLPPCSLPRGINWVCGYSKNVPNGTVYLSRKAFLEGVLLEKLERINRETTVVPTFSGIKDGRWVLELAAWDDHVMKRDTKCKWREVTKRDDLDNLEFEWKNREFWRYEHDDDLYNNGTYTIDCMTHNVLSIPTNREKSVVQLKGAVKLYLKYEGAGKDWNSETTVHWSASIAFASTSLGLQIQLHPSRIEPSIHSTNVAHGAPGHATQTQVLSQLRSKFPDFIDFGILLGDLKNELEGMWMGVQVQAHELCVSRPVFNRRGDLLLELIVRGSRIESAPGTKRALNGKSSMMSLNGSVTPVSMNGNGHSTNETWFRHVVHKAGDTLGAYSPSLSRMSSASKVSTSSTVVSQETITAQTATSVSAISSVSAIKSEANGNGNGEVKDLVESEGPEEEL